MLIIAHRGASADAAENTPEAFRLADEQGADGVELDVRLSATGRLVVRHDPIPVIDDGQPEPGPSFARVLDACGDRMLVNVEIKNERAGRQPDHTSSLVGLTLGELDDRGPLATSRWLISSFSWSTILECRQQAPHIATALLCQVVDDETIDRVAAAGHRAIHPWEGSVSARLVDRCHAEGLLVNTWTCNDADRLVELGSYGVDGVCTDRPSMALAALGRTAVRSASWGTPA